MILDVTVSLESPRWKQLLKPYCETVQHACEAAVKAGIQDSGVRIRAKKNVLEMAVVLADDAFIQELNKTYRGKNKPTNVLSFPESRIPNPESCLGDIVLALETIEREAAEQGKKVRDHATHLLVHGTLHLLGCDHEKDKDAKCMEALEIKALKSLGIANPYLLDKC